MSDGKAGPPRNLDASPGQHAASIDELLDEAVAAINRGDRAVAAALAGRVLEVDRGNADAEDLLTAPSKGGEIRRLTMMFADLVDSTMLSTRVEPETYRMLVGRYHEYVHAVVNRFEGHIISTHGDGLLAVFGHPVAHEDDARRAVHAGLELTRKMSRLRELATHRFGVAIDVRVGVHRGMVYLDTTQDDVFGLGANLASRVSGLAPPGSVVVSDAVEPLVRKAFDLDARPPAPVKGVDRLIAHYHVIAERAEPAKTSRGPLVGRERELAWLQQSWARVQSGTLTIPGLVFHGEPGIGKSRLAAAATELVEDSRAVVLELFGSPFHTDVGLHPVRTLLERRCGIHPNTDSAERVRLLEAEVRAVGLDPLSTVPLLAPVLGIGARHGYEPVAAEGDKLYQLIAAAIQNYLLTCVGAGTGLLVAEDVHWYDASTLDILGALLRADSRRLLVVGTARPQSSLPSDWPIEVRGLTPLTDEQTNELIAVLDPSLTPEDRAAVVNRCDGVPFYIEQVVKGLGQSGVPEALYEPLFARLRAGANVVQVVEAAALIGRHVDRRLLYSVVDMSGDEVHDVIDELEGALVLEPWGTDGWRFRHELLREVASELAPPSVRRELHAQVAEALVGVAGSAEPDWPLVAAHYEHAQRFAEAASAYQKASSGARRRGALAEARTHLTRALAQLDREAPGPDRDRREIAARLRRGFLIVASEGNHSHEAAAEFQRCLQLGGTDLRDDELAVTLMALLFYYVVRADLRRADRILELLNAGLGEGREWFRPIIDVSFGSVEWLRGHFDAAGPQLERATAGQAATDSHGIAVLPFLPNEPMTTAHNHLALTHFVHGDLISAEGELALTAPRVEQLGFPQRPFSLAYARFVEAWLCIETGELDRAAVFAAEVTDLGERHGFDMWRLFGAGQQASVRALAAVGDAVAPTVLAGHIATISTFLDTWYTAGLNLYRTFFDGVLGRLLIAAGQPEQARASLDAALQLSQDTEMHFYDAELLRLRARTHTDDSKRRADIVAALEIARRQGAVLFELRAALDDFELRGEPARAALMEAASRIPADSALPELARARTILSDDSHPT